MNKIKVTAKAIRNDGTKHICLGYCEAAHLFRSFDPLFYTCGVYGWNFDAYRFYHNNEVYTICTGYRGMIGNRPAVPVTEYEAAARAIWEDYSRSYEEKTAAAYSLLHEWLTACEEVEK